MALQQKVIQRLMRTLKDTSGDNVIERLNEAVKSCHSKYKTMQEVVDECIYQRTLFTNPIEFLKKRCGIILNNEDTGSILGFDACGGNMLSDVEVVPEHYISDWEYPINQTNTYRGLEVVYNPPTTQDQQFIIGCLHTWWIKNILKIIERSFGFGFNLPKATPKRLIVVFEDAGQDALAYISTYTNPATGQVEQMGLFINNEFYYNMDYNNPNGLSLANPDQGYLDRVLLHEFTHAVQAANFNYFSKLAQENLWFTEGSAEVMHGIDDERIYNIGQVMTDNDRFARAFTDTPDNQEDPYSAGYILLRYFMRQVANGYTQNYRLKRHLMTEKGNVKSLEAIGHKFLEFVRRSNNGVQAWTDPGDGMQPGTLSSFFGETVKIPMRRWADTNAEEDYFLLTSSIMKEPTDSTFINFIDVLTAQYPKVNVTENYTMTKLDDVLNIIGTLALDEKSHVLFSGCELDIANGSKAVEVLSKLKTIVSTLNNLDINPAILLTPTLDIYDNDNIKEEYAKLLRSSFISRKLTMVCLGDSITDPNNTKSWTEFCQEQLPNVHIINKGVGGNKTADALARFDADVVEEVPDLCFLLIGGNDLWTANPADLATAKTNWKTLVDRCVLNNITPVVGLYLPTIEQCQVFMNTDLQTARQIRQMFKEYYNYCKQVAIDNGYIYIDTYKNLHNIGDGSINKKYVIADLIHLDIPGQEVVGKDVAVALKDYLYKMEINLAQPFRLVNLYQLFCKKLGTDTLTKTQLTNLIENGHYKEGQVNDYITEYIFSEGVLLPYRCPCFYLTLEHQSIVAEGRNNRNNTYAKWLNSCYYVPGFVYNKYYDGTYKATLGASTDSYRRIVYQGERYLDDFGDSNLFVSSGEFMAFGLHTLYDDNLWMCEQGGVTCEYEATNQVVPMNWLCKDFHRTSTGYANFPPGSKMPIYPGTGCPWLTISEKNKTDFDIMNRGIDYWFTKSDYDATITIRAGNGIDDDAYQSISLGLMVNVNDDSYLFPLYVAGGSQGIAEDIIVYSNPTPPGALQRNGNMYNLDMKRISMSNSNLLTPTKFNGASISNFKVLAPSGTWKNIFAFQQDAEVRVHPHCGSYPSNYYIVLKEPTSIGGSYHSAYPFLNDNRNKIDMCDLENIKNKSKSSSVLDRVIVSMNGDLDYKENGVMGVLPNCYSSWTRTLSVGEVDIDGKKYLSIPNGWEHRLWYYPWKIGFLPQVREDWNAEVMQQYWEEYFNPLYNKVMLHRLLIPLEEEGE